VKHMTEPTLDILALDPAAFARHLDDLAGILHACVHAGASVSFVLPFEREAARDFWRRKVAPGVEAGERIVLLATSAGRPAGTVQLVLDTPPNQPHRADVAKLLVHPDFRRAGIARALMRRLEVHAREADRTLLTLDTRTGDAAEPLYASLGFATAGIVPHYSRDPAHPDRFDATTFMYKLLDRGGGEGLRGGETGAGAATAGA
jgi:ribosomal protein S18 acetylase RimI-like enzyme